MNKQKLIKLLSKGIDVNQFCILELISKGEDLSSITESKVSGWILLLKKKQLLDENGGISVQGSFLLSEIAGLEENAVEKEEPDQKPVLQSKFDYNGWVNELHKKLQDRMVALTGKKQKVISERYSFLCNAADLGGQLSKIINRYKIIKEEFPKIETILLRHIDNSFKAKWDKVSLVYYYILKDGHSRLITDLENFEEEPEEKEDLNIKLIDTKNLF